jgi:exodeoxyribonuclease V beta subunit
LIREYDPLSAGCPPLNFRQVQGMLKGFIDLVFRHEGRYLLDYKSNWLGGEQRSLYPTGDGLSDANASLRSAVSALYPGAAPLPAPSLADYRYEDHFGGVIYLFLRGVDANDPQSGVFSTRPAAELKKWITCLPQARRRWHDDAGATAGRG